MVEDKIILTPSTVCICVCERERDSWFTVTHVLTLSRARHHKWPTKLELSPCPKLPVMRCRNYSVLGGLISNQNTERKKKERIECLSSERKYLS